ncbi:MAG: hypothetical protein MJE66_01210, partial [Proteobacteria bacterium]|nr:hypothetical protein [Pseudomonadota bacterium]
MGTERELATWLVSCRREIERRMVETLGPAAPAAAEPEAEALRRFRSYAASALLRGDAAGEPALDGVRPNERRMGALLTALERDNPHVRSVMLNALRNVQPSHLLDPAVCRVDRASGA